MCGHQRQFTILKEDEWRFRDRFGIWKKKQLPTDCTTKQLKFGQNVSFICSFFSIFSPTHDTLRGQAPARHHYHQGRRALLLSPINCLSDSIQSSSHNGASGICGHWCRECELALWSAACQRIFKVEWVSLDGTEKTCVFSTSVPTLIIPPATKTAMNVSYTRVQHVNRSLMALIPCVRLFHKLSNTHQWVTLSHWVASTLITITTHTVIYFIYFIHDSPP